MSGFKLPSMVLAAGFGLRPQRDDDYAFLERLYFSVRWEEIEPLDWPDALKRAFLADQCRLQHAHYQKFYYNAEFLILEKAGEPVGRLYIFRGGSEHRVVDISLLPQVRGGGIGGALLQAVQAEAAGLGKTVSLHVEKCNPAQNLYRRLGFRDIGEDGPYRLMVWQAILPAAATENRFS